VIFKYSRVYERITFRLIKEQFSREYHVVCYGKQTAQVKKVYIFVLKAVLYSRPARNYSEDQLFIFLYPWRSKLGISLEEYDTVFKIYLC